MWHQLSARQSLLFIADIVSVVESGLPTPPESNPADVSGRVASKRSANMCTDVSGVTGAGDTEDVRNQPSDGCCTLETTLLLT